MGCFFGCFGIRDDEQRRNHLISSSIPSTSKVSRDPLMRKKPLGSFFVSEENDQVANVSSQNSSYKDRSYIELKNEAQFLKSCGALLQTPLEIRRATAFYTNQHCNEDIVSSNSQSMLPDTSGSGKKLVWDDEPGELYRSPVKMQEGTWISENNSESYTHKEHQAPKLHESALPSVCLGKTVCLEDVKTESGVESLMDTEEPVKSPHENKCWIQQNASRSSPFPTPLKVTDEMQTPTVYPANIDHVKPGKNARIRTHTAYPLLNPVENMSQWKALTEDSSEHTPSHNSEEKMDCNVKETQNILLTSEPMDSKLPGALRIASSYDKSRKNRAVIYNSDENPFEKNPINLSAPTDNGERVVLSSENPEVVVTSLSNWLKPPVLHDKGVINKTYSEEKSHCGKSSDAERPIIGMVAAHWNEREPARQSPKCWDGNGIPNSTDKYKEDQRVSWHATPFEERLEKALSDESFLTQRNFLQGKLIGCENELSDTATS